MAAAGAKLRMKRPLLGELGSEKPETCIFINLFIYLYISLPFPRLGVGGVQKTLTVLEGVG